MELIYLYFLPVTMIVAWIVVFVVTGRYKQLHDRIFMAFLVIGGATLFISQQVIQNGRCDYPYIVYNGLELLFEMSVCPLLFIYIRTVARDVRWRNWYLWLFTPAVLFCVAYFAVSSAVGWDRIIEITGYCSPSFTPSPDSMAEKMLKLITVDLYYITIVLMEFVLMAMSVHALVRYLRSSANFFANLEDSCSDKMRNALASVIVLLLSTILFTWIFPETNNDAKSEFLVFRALWFSAVLWLIASNAHKIVLAEKQLDVLEFNNQEAEDAETEKDSAALLTNDSELANKIASWQESPDKPYCKEGLTLKDMATQINTDPRAISAYFKSTSSGSSQRKNFNYWINILRIEEAKRLFRTNPDFKISYISSLCGYPTHSSFTRAFKQIEGKSPQEYRDSEHKVGVQN